MNDCHSIVCLTAFCYSILSVILHVILLFVILVSSTCLDVILLIVILFLSFQSCHLYEMPFC